MSEKIEWIWFNAQPRTLSRAVVLVGKKVDPLSGGFFTTDSYFLVKPSEKNGIHFRVGDVLIPYNQNHLTAIDSKLGRMLRVEDDKKTIQILLVEHLLSALQVLWLTNIEIVLDKSSYGPSTSTKVPIFWLGHPTHWIPVMWPGISGFVKELSPYCTSLSQVPQIVKIKSAQTHSIIDPNARYKWIKRSLSIEPADRLIIQVLSAQQPDIINNPHAMPVEISEWNNLQEFLRARPIMRLRNKFEESVLFLLNLRSFALTRDTYFRSRNSMTVEEVVIRMFPEFQTSQNEHLYHTALADFPAELWAFLQWRHLHAKIKIQDTNHLFRMGALRVLLTPEVLWE